MDALAKENKLLRSGLADAWDAVSNIRKEFTAYVNTTQTVLATRDNRILTLESENAEL